MEITYRLYLEKDQKISEQLLAKLAGELSAINKYRRHIPAKEYGNNYLNTFLKDPLSTIYVAETTDTKQIVGIVVGKIESPKDNELMEFRHFRSGHITDLYVEKDFRRYGIGKHLLQLLETFFKEADCDLIEIDVLASNTPAYNLYKTMRFDDFYFSLRKVLK